MRIAAVVSVLVVGLAVVIGSVSAPAQSAPDDMLAVPATSATMASDRPATPEGDLVPASARFATLDGIVAVPMASSELSAVRGLHIHFVTPSSNTGHPLVAPLEGWHFVNSQNTDNWIDFGNGPAGPGYHGLCGAALKSPALFIPGQGTAPDNGGC